MARVLFENVTKRFGDVVAVNDLNLEVQDKEFMVLVGPSGCGKTTALRMLAGLEEITSGNIYIGDNLVNEVHPKDRDIAMVFQSYAIYPHMTVYDNIAFGLRLRKKLPFYDEGESHNGRTNGSLDFLARRRAREAAIRRQVEEVARMTELTQFLNRRPSQLSGGQRQRVALARAIVRQPQVFLMDEPLSNLDAKLRVTTRAELQKLHRRLGVTTIYVTHDQVEAMTMADRVAVMKDGVLQQVDTPINLYEHPANVFVAGFIGSPAMNMFTVGVEGDAEGLFLRGPGFRVRVPEQYARKLAGYHQRQILLGLRPEAIHDARFALDADPATVVEALVEVVEPLGRDVNLYLSTGEVPFVAHVDDRTEAAPGQRIRVVFDTARMNAFDINTQQAIL